MLTGPEQARESALREIAGRAATLWERVQAPAAAAEPLDPQFVNARIDDWTKRAARGDRTLFVRRLAWDGLDIGALHRAIGGTRWDDAVLPRWADTLRDVLRAADAAADHDDSASDDESCPADPDHPQPFEEVVAPFVVVARRRLAATAGESATAVSGGVETALARELRRTLSHYSSRALYLEFSLTRAREQSALARLISGGDAEANRRIYQRFVDRMRRGGLLPFFQEYAVLGRLLATIVDLWVDAAVEFLGRLTVDRPLLESRWGCELGRLVSIEGGLSDPHCGRRFVLSLVFASGRRVVYKPKDLGAEAAYNRLLAWLNDRGSPLPFKVVGVVNRSTHGWVEYVPHRGCDHSDQAQRFHRRAGMLLCLLYVLEATDCHLDNVVAHGEHPVLIDPETLLQSRMPEVEPQEATGALRACYRQLAYSVLRTGFLPTWQVGGDGRGAYDISGLGGGSNQPIPVRKTTWRWINTDRMEPAFEPPAIRGATNVPMLGGAPLRLEDFRQAVIDGFREMYSFLSANREALVAPDGPLQMFRGQRVRYLHRDTRTYAAILDSLVDPEPLRDGARQSILLELLNRAALGSAGRPFWWPIAAAERRALEQLDVPFFTVHTDGTALEAGSTDVVEHCFPESSFDRVTRVVATLSAEDLERQVTLIEGALFARSAHEPVSHADGPSQPSPSSDETDSRLLVEAACRVARELQQRALIDGDGSAAWLGPHYLVRARRYQLQPLGYDLYGGSCGIALFLAAAAKIADDGGCRALAMNALQPLRRDLRHRNSSLERTLDLGGGTGLGGIAYALVRISQLLGEPVLVEEARAAALLMTSDRIAADRDLDVLSGCAGSLLGLLAVYDAISDPEVLRRAVMCGERLLGARTETACGRRSWATLDGVHLTGFAHGAAGIAYALVRLYERSRAEPLLEAAREAVAYETAVFSRDALGWPDLRNPTHPTFPSQWCHGAAGIGLARVGGVRTLDTPQIREDIEFALASIQRAGMAAVDHLCCGNGGRCELLLTVGLRLSNRKAIARARNRAAAMIARASRQGGFGLHPLLPQRVYSPGFFQGTAGIGYELLRLAHPDALPSVLLWE